MKTKPPLSSNGYLPMNNTKTYKGYGGTRYSDPNLRGNVTVRRDGDGPPVGTGGVEMNWAASRPEQWTKPSPHSGSVSHMLPNAQRPGEVTRPRAVATGGKLQRTPRQGVQKAPPAHESGPVTRRKIVGAKPARKVIAKRGSDLYWRRNG